MAVIQISRIQHRRGLRVDLPNPLNEAELGWTTDTRELFIGNGPLFPGNTQILTDHTTAGVPQYVYRHPYTYQNILNQPDALMASTGYLSTEDGGTPSDELIPNDRFNTARSYQELFDERASIKDYGAEGDKTTDDTGAFWRAGQDLYGEQDGNDVTDERRRRLLYVPAGVYRVRQWLPLYPFTLMVGDGIGKTIIFLDYTELVGTAAPIDSVVKTVDSLGQSGTDMGQDIGNGVPTFLPEGLQVQGIEFRSTADQAGLAISNRQIAELRGIRKSMFKGCAFNYVDDAEAPIETLAWQHGDSAVNGTAGVMCPDIPGGIEASGMADLTFENCETTGSAFGFNFIDKVSNVSIKNHTYGTHYQNTKIGYDGTVDTDSSRDPLFPGDGGPEYIRSTQSDNMNNESVGFMVHATAGPGHVSLANYYADPVDANVPAVYFVSGTSVCSSTNDTFEEDEVLYCDSNLNPGGRDAILDNNRVRNLATSANTVMNAQDAFQIPLGTTELTVCGDLTVHGNLIIIPFNTLGQAAVSPLEITRVNYPSTAIDPYGNVVIMDYGLRSNADAGLVRSGTFRIAYEEDPVGTGSAMSYDDDYVEVSGPPANAIWLTASFDDINDQIIIYVNFTGAAPDVSYTIKTLTV